MGIVPKEEMRRVISSLTLMDDVFFSRCFSENIKCTALLLRIILGREDLEVVETRTQEWMQSIANHSVRLDIFARDKKGNIYDIEIQNVQAGNFCNLHYAGRCYRGWKSIVHY